MDAVSDDPAPTRPARTVHLDAAAAGRSPVAVRAAVRAHLDREADDGAYVAALAVEPLLARARTELAGLLGLAPDGVAFTESASTALAALLRVWPLAAGDRVAVVPSEWGPNRAAFADAGLVAHELPVDGGGVLDVAALADRLAADPPALVHLTHVAAHRALVQPVADALVVCRAAGVPLWVDAAQALGHVDTAVGADATYATSRKWLRGPRGVGLLAVAAPWWDALRLPAAARVFGADGPPVRLLESSEANVAGRVGLATAVAGHVADGPARVHAGLAAVGRRTREALAGVPGWEVVDPLDAPVATTALRATGREDVVAARARLLAEHRVVTTAGLPARAPGEMREPLLRVSPHLDATDDDLAALRSGLSATGG